MARYLQPIFVALAVFLSFITAAPAPTNNGSTFHAEQSSSAAAVSGYRNAAYFVNWWDVQ